MKKKVCFLITHNADGGAQILWEHLAEEIERKGFSVHLVALYRYSEEDRRPGWHELLPRRASGLIDLWLIMWRLRAYLKTNGIDAVISALPAANAIGAIVSVFAGVKSRLSSHHSPVDTHNRIICIIDRFAGTSAAVTKTICVSRAVRDSLNGYPKKYLAKVVVIRNALAPSIRSYLDNIARRRTDIPHDRPAIFIAAGRLAPQKNFTTLIQAMVQLQNARLVVVGDGPERHKLHELCATLKIVDKVEFLGRLTHQETLQAMANADIFVQPSLFEGHSIALLEAARLGLPIIASDIPTQTEALCRSDGTMSGVVFPTMSSDDLAIAMHDVARTSGRIAELSALALELSQEFTFENVVDAYIRESCLKPLT